VRVAACSVAVQSARPIPLIVIGFRNRTNWVMSVHTPAETMLRSSTLTPRELAPAPGNVATYTSPSQRAYGERHGCRLRRPADHHHLPAPHAGRWSSSPVTPTAHAAG